MLCKQGIEFNKKFKRKDIEPKKTSTTRLLGYKTHRAVVESLERAVLTNGIGGVVGEIEILSFAQ